MKKLLTILVCSALLISCGKNKPDDKVYETKKEFVGWKPNGVGNKPVEVYEEMVMLKPTWGQSNHIARERGDHAVWQVVAWVLLIASIALVLAYALDYISLDAKAFGGSLFVLLALSLTSFKWDSASIKWDNNVFVLKTQYDKAIKESGSTKPIWDSLENGCHISWGPYKCYK